MRDWDRRVREASRRFGDDAFLSDTLFRESSRSLDRLSDLERRRPLERCLSVDFCRECDLRLLWLLLLWLLLPCGDRLREADRFFDRERLRGDVFLLDPERRRS